MEGDEHAGNLYVILVGETNKARKGTSWGQTRRLFALVDPEWATRRIVSGLSSGEGAIWGVRDPIEKSQPIREKGQVVGYEMVMVDPGEPDKRLLVLEPEFASTLRVMRREGNTLSPVVRQAWDAGNLRSLTKNSPAVATNAHVSIIGHITRDELRREFSETDLVNGVANRFLWCCARRSKVLPGGGRLEDSALEEFAGRLRSVLEEARKVRQVGRSDAATEYWAGLYTDLSQGEPGLIGAVTSRAEAQVVRLALVHVLLAGRSVVEVEDLEAALAMWNYCAMSARYIFGTAAPERPEDLSRRQLVQVIRGRGGKVAARDLVRSGPRRLRGDTDAVDKALNDLLTAGLGRWHVEPSGPQGGRPRTMFVLGGVDADDETAGFNGNGEYPHPVSSLGGDR